MRLPNASDKAIFRKYSAVGWRMSKSKTISIYCEHYQGVIELIGRRWMGAILRALMSGEPRRFNELLAAIPGLSDRLLTERLRELTEQEIVERVPAPDISPIAIQYRLTKSGRDLEVVVRAISTWARQWRGGP